MCTYIYIYIKFAYWYKKLEILTACGDVKTLNKPQLPSARLKALHAVHHGRTAVARGLPNLEIQVLHCSHFQLAVLCQNDHLAVQQNWIRFENDRAITILAITIHYNYNYNSLDTPDALFNMKSGCFFCGLTMSPALARHLAHSYRFALPACPSSQGTRGRAAVKQRGDEMGWAPQVLSTRCQCLMKSYYFDICWCHMTAICIM